MRMRCFCSVNALYKGASPPFACGEAIAILTLVAYTQLLTWPGARLRLQTQIQLKRKQLLGSPEAR